MSDRDRRLKQLTAAGADGLVMDGLDGAVVGEAAALAKPDVIVHQMTAISMTHAGKPARPGGEHAWISIGVGGSPLV
jgi:hypothetical protein